MNNENFFATNFLNLQQVEEFLNSEPGWKQYIVYSAWSEGFQNPQSLPIGVLEYYHDVTYGITQSEKNDFFDQQYVVNIVEMMVNHGLSLQDRLMNKYHLTSNFGDFIFQMDLDETLLQKIFNSFLIHAPNQVQKLFSSSLIPEISRDPKAYQSYQNLKVYCSNMLEKLKLQKIGVLDLSERNIKLL